MGPAGSGRTVFADDAGRPDEGIAAVTSTFRIRAPPDLPPGRDGGVEGPDAVYESVRVVDILTEW